MKVLVAGGFGNLGQEIVKCAVDFGHEVIACDLKLNEIPGYEGKYQKKVIDVTNKESLVNLCAGIDVVISTVGLTKSSKVVSHYDIDLNGNLALLNEALNSKVKKFIYTSVIKVDTDKTIPMLDAKNKFEKALLKSNIDYLIVRPSGYFYDIAKVFMPMIEKGKINLLKGVHSKANVISTKDLAHYIISNIESENKVVTIGGKETYSYEEIADLFIKASHKQCEIKYVPDFIFNILAFIAKITNNGRYASIRFGHWTLKNDMEADLKYGNDSFKEYVDHLYD